MHAQREDAAAEALHDFHEGKDDSAARAFEDEAEDRLVVVVVLVIITCQQKLHNAHEHRHAEQKPARAPPCGKICGNDVPK